jgi:putative transcriptional regulator
MAKFSLSKALLHRPRIDEAKLDATTEDDIRAYQEEDGYDPDFEPTDVRVVPGPRDVRVRLGLTQKEFAEALHIPLATVRNWEQGRTVPDAPARALLTVVAREPDAAFAALGTRIVPNDADEAAASQPLRRALHFVTLLRQAIVKIIEHIIRHPVDDIEENGEIVRWLAQDYFAVYLEGAGLDIAAADFRQWAAL